jgi:hypothetical protein
LSNWAVREWGAEEIVGLGGGLIRPWGKLHGERLYGLDCLPATVRTMKLRKMRWAGHVARMVNMTIAYRVVCSTLQTAVGWG